MNVNKNISLTQDEKIKVNAIIHTASVATGAMGIIPIGPADTLMITPAQIGMITSIGTVFNIRVSENLAKSILGGLGLSIAGRAVASTVLSLIPVVGWVIKGGTAAILTEAIGWTAVKHFHDIKENHSKMAGKKEGYSEASKEYEKKFTEQAEEFLKKGTVNEQEKEEYSKLVEELTKLIIELSINENCNTQENIEKVKYLNDLIKNLEKLNKVK